MTKTKPKMLTLTLKQATAYESYKGGVTESGLCEILGISKCAVHNYREALRTKGLIGVGKPGIKGSVPVKVIKPINYLVIGEEPINFIVTKTIKALASKIIDDHQFCLVLADALEEAGCTDGNLLKTLRDIQVPHGEYPREPSYDKTITREALSELYVEFSKQYHVWNAARRLYVPWLLKLKRIAARFS